MFIIEVTDIFTILMNVILKFVALQSVILLNAMESFWLHLWLLDIRAKDPFVAL